MAARTGVVRLATRGSALALAQARLVADLLEGTETGLAVELVTVRTAGDERPGAQADGAGAARAPTPGELAAEGQPSDKSRFVKEIEDVLLAGDADLAVHSAKDVPGELPDGLAIVGVPARADPRDALCGAESLGDLPRGARVGTSSLRRRAQLLAAREDLDLQELRGNVDTRLRRLAAGDFDAVVLALAGLERLGHQGGSPIAAAEMTPAPGQGCLVLEARQDDAGAAELAGGITDRPALVRLTAERAVTTALEADCETPIGVHAALVNGTPDLVLEAFVGAPDGSVWIRDRLEGDGKAPSEVGRGAAERLLRAGAAEVLAQA